MNFPTAHGPAQLRNAPPDREPLEAALAQSSALAAGQLLGLALPRTDKRLIIFTETDGCYADGLSAASGCWLGRRTLRLMDYGRVALTAADTRSGQTVRVWPQTDLRGRVQAGLGAGQKRYQAYLDAYLSWPDAELLAAQWVQLNLDLDGLISRHGPREVCSACGEEVINERWVRRGKRILCPACLSGAYYV